MSRLFQIFGLLLAAMVTGVAAEPAAVRHLPKANVLPLALDDDFSFRKQSIFLYDPILKQKGGSSPMLDFERMRIEYGAVTATERQERFGHYYRFWWRAGRKADITVRLEYRQQNLGAYVQAQEVTVPGAEGTLETKFQVTGDDYNQDGRVTSWRVLLIENQKIVGLAQSFLWH